MQREFIKKVEDLLEKALDSYIAGNSYFTPEIPGGFVSFSHVSTPEQIVDMCSRILLAERLKSHAAP